MKWKLVIPKKLLPIIVSNFKQFNGDIREWKEFSPEAQDSGFLVEVKEPMKVDEALKEFGEMLNVEPQPFRDIWTMAQENLLLEQSLEHDHIEHIRLKEQENDLTD